MATIQCPGIIVTGSTGEALCQDSVGGAVAWVVVPEFDISDVIASGQAAGYFAAGFTLIAICELLGIAIAAILSPLKKA